LKGRLLFSIGTFALMAFGAGGNAAAQSVDNAPSTVREQERAVLYREGIALAEAGRWAEALEKFERVVAIRSAPRALIALATAEEKSGKWLRAKRTYERTLVDAKADGETDLVLQADAALRGLEPRIPRVNLSFAPSLAAAQATLDGTPLTSPMGPIEMDPGEHRVLVRASGMSPFERTFQISAGAHETLSIAPPTDDALRSSMKFDSSPPVDPRPGGAFRSPPMATWILGGAGIAATAVGWIVRSNGRAQYDEAGASCTGNRCASSDLADRGNAGREQMLAGTVVSAIGVAGIAGAGVWWVVSASPSERATAPGAPSGRAAAWTLQLNGRF
jgi:hypothetical protein